MHLLDMEIKAPARYVQAAWIFLEEAEKVSKDPPELAPFFLRLEIFLGGCASMLRIACEYVYGDLRKAPDPDVMAFITAARHRASHPRLQPIRSYLYGHRKQWDPRQKTGHVDMYLTLSLNLDDKSERNEPWREGAKKYLAAHDGDIFRALHAATRQVATWTDTTLDDDFAKLLDSTVGRPLLRATFRSRKAFDAWQRVTLRAGRVGMECTFELRGRWNYADVPEEAILRKRPKPVAGKR